MYRKNKERSLGRCDECGLPQVVTVYADEVRSIGTGSTCPCGSDALRVLEIDPDDAQS